MNIATQVFGKEATIALDALLKPVSRYYVRCNTRLVAPEDLAKKLEARGLNVHQHPAVPEALSIDVEGTFEIQEAEQRIVVDKKAAESVLQGANVYSPGVLACGATRVGDLVNVVSEFDDVLAYGEATMSANEILTFRRGLAVRISERRFKAPQVRELPEYSEGLLYPQSLPAMLTSHVLDPKQGETIVDMNCAPGGKLSHLSQLTQNAGKVIGFDRNSHKVAQARETVARLGCTNVTLSVHDSRYLDVDMPDLKADRVLIDPPCSALGLRPKIYDFTEENRVMQLAEYQKQFINAASRVVKPSGFIVYSVCTFTRQECEQIVEYAERECGLRVVEQEPFLGSKGLIDISPSGASCQRFHPHLHEIGYFIAKFTR